MLEIFLMKACLVGEDPSLHSALTLELEYLYIALCKTTAQAH